MKKHHRLFILFVLLLLVPIKAVAGEHHQQVPMIDGLTEAISFWESRIDTQHPLSLVPKMSPAELDRLRGKGSCSGENDTTTASTESGRVILWDENCSSVTKGMQDMNINSGVGAKQVNSLVFQKK